MSNPLEFSSAAGQDLVQPLVRKSLSEQVADELRNLILVEKLKPGAVIPERETAEALGVSRTPVRESLRLLAAEGLVDVAPNRPPRVADPSLQDIQHWLQVQGALESLAGELACRVASDADIEAIAGLESSMREISDTAEPLEFFKKDMVFHSAIVRASGNAALMETHTTYNARLWRARFISSQRRVNRDGTLMQHRAIAEALLKRDASAASIALKHHLETGYSNISKVLQQLDQTIDKRT